MNYFDSHCHLQDERFGEGIGDVLNRAKMVGVRECVCCGALQKDWGKVWELANRFDYLVPSFGVHPWFVDSVSANWREDLKEYLRKIPSGVGECGLDFVGEKCDRELQEYVFIEQLKIAKELNRPISIHCRKAWGRLILILKEIHPLPAGGLIHSYSGSCELIPQLEQLGFYISFSGTVTNEKSIRVRKSVLKVSIDRLLIESDAPDLMPVIIDREHEKNNEPAFIIHTYKSIARIKKTSEKNLSEQIYRNSKKLFKSVLLG